MSKAANPLRVPNLEMPGFGKDVGLVSTSRATNPTKMRGRVNIKCLCTTHLPGTARAGRIINCLRNKTLMRHTRLRPKKRWQREASAKQLWLLAHNAERFSGTQCFWNVARNKKGQTHRQNASNMTQAGIRSPTQHRESEVSWTYFDAF